jgi:hypothetical protein
VSDPDLENCLGGHFESKHNDACNLKYPEEVELRRLIDASVVGYSNPSREALNEGKSISNGWSIKVIMNIGAGDRAQTTTPDRLSSSLPSRVHIALVRLLYEVSTDAKRVAYELERDGIDGRFYGRLNVESGLRSVHGMKFTTKSRTKIYSKTEDYLRCNPNVVGRINAWSTKLRESLDHTGESDQTNNDATYQSQTESRLLQGLFDTRSHK